MQKHDGKRRTSIEGLRSKKKKRTLQNQKKRTQIKSRRMKKKRRLVKQVLEKPPEKASRSARQVEKKVPWGIKRG